LDGGGARRIGRGGGRQLHAQAIDAQDHVGVPALAGKCLTLCRSEVQPGGSAA
jgi:hypothetical protein